MGTKSKIRALTLFPDGAGVLLSDYLFDLKNGFWQVNGASRGRRVALIAPISPMNLWFTENHETSTSSIYHIMDGKEIPVESPFPNEVTAIGFAHPDTGFFASFSEVMLVTPSGFTPLKNAPRGTHIIQLFAVSTSHFWALTRNSKVLEYRDGKYVERLPKDRIRDFSFVNGRCGFFLGDSLIYRMEDGTFKPFAVNPVPKAIQAIAASDSAGGWIAGSDGMVFRFTGDQLERVPFDKKLTFTKIAISPEGNIWLAGDQGALFYRGLSDYADYDGGTPGFTAHKVLYIGINLDNEYGVALADLNNDGTDDLYTVCIYHPNRLFINQAGNSIPFTPESDFSEEAVTRRASGISDPAAYSLPSELFLGVAVADIDNDGDQDIYLCSLNARNKLLLNNGKGVFRDVSHQDNRACDNLNRSNTAAFADIDLDGDLDLFVTSEEGSNRVYLNDGTGHFRDCTAGSGLETNGGGMCASFSDFDHDGLPDLCVTFWNDTNRLYRNRSSGRTISFWDITRQTPLGKQSPAKNNGVAFADINNDGWPDLFIAGRKSPNRLYLNDRKGSFILMPSTFLPDTLLLTNGVVFADLNLDGYTDLFLANVGANRFYENLGGKGFTDATLRYGLDAGGYSTGCAVSDIDRDGDPDLYVCNYLNENSTLYLNRMEGRQTVSFRLTGTRSNRDAIGTRIWLYTTSRMNGLDSLAGYRELHCGEGYGSVNSKTILFAADQNFTYHARLKFPSSPDTARIGGIVAGASLDVHEEQGLRAMASNLSRFFRQVFFDREIRKELIKYLVILVGLTIYLHQTRSGYRKIRIIRTASCLILFLLFILINQLLLFQRPGILFFISPAVVLIGLLIIHLITERIILRSITESEKRTLREKIARDLHDDLASTLGTISIYSDTLRSVQSPPEEYLRKLSGKISELTHAAKQSITDIIWMTSPQNDTLQGLILKVSVLIDDTLMHQCIGVERMLSLPEAPVYLRENLRNNLFLILKEALTNILKHAGASEVTFRVEPDGARCRILLSDNGRGFILNSPSGKRVPGNGIVNMHRRAAESGIRMEMVAAPEQGTRISLDFEIPPNG